MEYNNLFDDNQAQFLILQNQRCQYSLWPVSCLLPDGWRVVAGPEVQAACFDWLARQGARLTPDCFARETFAGETFAREM